MVVAFFAHDHLVFIVDVTLPPRRLGQLLDGSPEHLTEFPQLLRVAAAQLLQRGDLVGVGFRVGGVEGVEPLDQGMPPQLCALYGIEGGPVAAHEENCQARIDFDNVFFGQFILGSALDEWAEICPPAIRDPHDATCQIQQRFRQPFPVAASVRISPYSLQEGVSAEPDLLAGPLLGRKRQAVLPYVEVCLRWPVASRDEYVYAFDRRDFLLAAKYLGGYTKQGRP